MSSRKKTKTKKPATKYIFVMGGVMSGIGKGITASSIGTVLQSKGYRVTLMKADPYLNVDAGTMNPTEHGEVFVLENGLETDQDMGNYERFLNRTLPPENYMTNGMVFKYVIDKERALGYKGKCVEPTYHITEEILRRIAIAQKKTDAEVVVVEIGGTIGEYQNAIFLEAARQLKLKHPHDVINIMVSYLPMPAKLGEMKTKPTQNAVRQLNAYGMNPHMIIARSEVPIDKKRKEKIAYMCSLPIEHIISAPDVNSIYEVPINFEKDGLGKALISLLGLPRKKEDDTLHAWKRFLSKKNNPKDTIRIAIPGKYFDTGDFVLSDAYISVIEAIKAAAYHEQVEPIIDWINVKDFEDRPETLKNLKNYDAILVPGGFGASGIEGKISVIAYARKNKIPYFGICYGMQLMVVEYARHVARLSGAHTVEVDPKTQYPVINVMESQKEHLEQGIYGGTMRLGSYIAHIQPKTQAYKMYKNTVITERHRHRYEVNPEYIEQLTKAGLVFSGTSPDGVLMEIAELPATEHPFFVGTQFHPEFLSRPLAPHPIFTGFIKAAKNKKKSK
ncbi:MAG: CTP synthase [Candidatus Pacebacteria bacterium]|nr:CTP synthase [Candidatus Paceibacterota bacterium]MCD8563655.1 CTP synthase [Candidatus Paceibacterota bacterium]